MVTFTHVLLVQLFLVPVTQKSVVLSGLITTTEHVAQSSKALFDQLYSSAPFTVTVALVPQLNLMLLGFSSNTGLLFSITCAVLLPAALHNTTALF